MVENAAFPWEMTHFSPFGVPFPQEMVQNGENAAFPGNDSFKAFLQMVKNGEQW